MKYEMQSETTGQIADFELRSDGFSNGETIPRRYTCDGENVSPALTWSRPPEGTRSFVLIVEDPDAPRGTFTHWVLYNVPPQVNRLPEAVPQGDLLSWGAEQGRNDFGDDGYGGPCPPPGVPHRYYFRLSALSDTLALQPGASVSEVNQAMQGKLLGVSETMGRYARQR